MNADRLAEEQWADWLAAADDALAAGSRVEGLSIPGAPDELQLDVAYAALVRRALRPTARVGSSVPSDPGSEHEMSGEGTQEVFDFLRPPDGPGAIGRLGTYRIERILGAGGMGVVFLAIDPQLQRRVALKAMRPALAVSAAARQRFVREARAMAAVKDERIVTIHQVGEERGLPFLAMELLEGETLERRLAREGRLPVAETVRIGREAALGLAAAHEQGLIHRDVKPANLWLQNVGQAFQPAGATADRNVCPTVRVKLLDFGLARVADRASSLTGMGVLGTPAYMAPEQAQGHAVDHRSDLFSLGCVLYRLCTGRVPFEGRDTLTLLASMALQRPKPPREINPEVPPALSDLILRLLARDPADRPESARAVAEALGRMEEKRDKRDGRDKRDKKRQMVVGLAVALLLGAVVLAGVVLTLQTRHGTLVVNVSEPGAKVLVDGEERLTIDSAKTGRLELVPGEHRVTIKRGHEEMLTESFTLRSGGEVIVQARWEPLQAAKPTVAVLAPPAVDDAWLKVSPALEPELQAAVVKSELKKRNPGFDAEVQAVIQDGAVTELVIANNDHVTDLTPVRLLTGLQALMCNGKEKGKLTDLTPLKGLPLKRLQCANNQIRDLTPLRGLTTLKILHLASNPLSDLAPLAGLSLEELRLTDTRARDLTPLSTMKLRCLHCAATPVRDLTPLRGMPLEHLACFLAWPGPSYQPRDLSPLKDLPLKTVECDFIPERDVELLRSIKTLEKINNQPVGEVWKKLEAERAAFVEWRMALRKMPAQKQVDEVVARLKELNPGFNGPVTPTIENETVTGLELCSDAVKDLSPVRALDGLRGLSCAGSGGDQGRLQNLWPLSELSLTRLNLAHNPDLADLSPLKRMPLVEIEVPFQFERDAAILRSIKTLEKINGRAVGEVLKPGEKALPGN